MQPSDSGVSSVEACRAARRRLIEKRRKKRQARRAHPYRAGIATQPGGTSASASPASPSQKIAQLRKAYDAALTSGASKTDLRRIRNRLSAAISRENKEQKLVELAQQSSNLWKANSLLRQRLSDAEQEVESLKAALLQARSKNNNGDITTTSSNLSDSLSTDSAEIGVPTNGPTPYRTSLLEIRKQRDLMMKVWTLMYLIASTSSPQSGPPNGVMTSIPRARISRVRHRRRQRRRRSGMPTRREKVRCRVSVRKRSPGQYLIQYSIRKTVLFSTPPLSSPQAQQIHLLPADKSGGAPPV